MNYGSESRNKSSSLNEGEDEEVTYELSDNLSRFPKRSNGIMMYAQGKHKQFSNDRRVHPVICTR